MYNKHMIYADSHIEFIHHPEDLKNIPDPIFLESQINPVLINQAQPDLLFAAAYVDPGEEAWPRLLWLIDKYKEVAENNHWKIALNKEDLESPGVKLILHVESLHAIGQDLDKIDLLFNLGIRSIGLTHNPSNQFGGGSHTAEIGLSYLGKAAAVHLTKLGIIWDFAHLSTKAFQDAVDLGLQKPFVSHAGIQAVFANPRNLANSALYLLAKNEGYLGIGLAASFLSDSKVDCKDLTWQIDFAVEKLGDRAVGIGSDFGGIISGVPEGLENISRLKEWAEKLTCPQVGGQNLQDFLANSNLVDL